VGKVKLLLLLLLLLLLFLSKKKCAHYYDWVFYVRNSRDWSLEL